MWGLATVWDQLRAGEVAAAHGSLSLLLVAAEQCAMDDGRWPLAWLLSLQPEPPWATMSRRKEVLPLRPFGRLADARWIAAATGYIRDMDRLNTVRRSAAGLPKTDPSDTTAQASGGDSKAKGGKGKGKDPPTPGA